MSERAPSSPTPLGRRLLRTGAALTVLLAIAVYLGVRHGPNGSRATPGCAVVSGKDDGSMFRFTFEQAVNAATISAVGTSRGMPERAVTIALATALQESGLRNLDHGDRDSLGLFQQRPSQGWGTRQQIMDPVYAARRFYEHLAKVPDYPRLPLTVAAQRVQRSGYPQAYAKHEPDATLLAAAFTGRTAATLTCEGSTHSRPGDPAEVRKALVHDFGSDVLKAAASSSPAKDRGTAGRPSSAHEDAATRARSGATAGENGAVPGQDARGRQDAKGTKEAAAARGEDRTVTVPVRAGDGGTHGDARRRGWELAHWAVANSSALHIERVGYGDRVWTAASGAAWQSTGRHAADGKNAETGENGAGGGPAEPGQDEVLIVTAR